jgi:hypothetical protein
MGPGAIGVHEIVQSLFVKRIRKIAGLDKQAG